MITYFFIAPKGFFENMLASDYLSIQTKYCMADRDLVHKEKPQHLQWPDYLSNDQIKGYLSRINGRHTFLIADSCFSGAFVQEGWRATP